MLHENLLLYMSAKTAQWPIQSHYPLHIFTTVTTHCYAQPLSCDTFAMCCSCHVTNSPCETFVMWQEQVLVSYTSSVYISSQSGKCTHVPCQGSVHMYCFSISMGDTGVSLTASVRSLECIRFFDYSVGQISFSSSPLSNQLLQETLQTAAQPQAMCMC